MKKIQNILILWVALIIIGSPAQAQKSEGDWQIIFNGKDFTGWRQLNGKHKFEVKDGMIVGTTIPGEPNGFLCTEKEYDDFILELEVSIDTTMNNSGIQFRSLSYADYQNFRVHGYQMEVDPKPQRWSGAIYDEARRGWLYTTDMNPASKPAFKNKQWNQYRIECFGPDIRTWVNGVPVSHLIDNETLKGFVGLQMHSNNPTDPIGPGAHQIRFRNIRIQTTNLKPSPPDDIFVVNLIPNDLSAKEKKQGYALLWDGKTVQQWGGANQTPFPADAWELNNGELTIRAAKGQTGALPKSLFTKKQYGAFELKFEFKLTEGADSGVKYLLANSDESQSNQGLEFQIQDDTKPSDMTKEEASKHTLASLNGLLASQQSFWIKRKIGIWNNAMIRVYPDNRIEHWLNGFKMLEFQWDSPAYASLMATLPTGGKASKGFIMLENKGYPVSYRSIKIKELR
jgi:hypothetical protein